MRKIAHIVHPVVVGPSSDLTVAQPITFETMRIAREFAAGKIDVEQFYTKYADENPSIPAGFSKVPDIDRSIADIANFSHKRKLALIKDILDRLYNATDAEYLIYTNVDIALMPQFYVAVDQMIEQGYDALVINRRSISKDYTEPQDIPLMYTQVGKPHPGSDCFVFKRSVYPDYQLGMSFIGSGRIGLIMAINLYYNANRFRQFRDVHLTFHVGNDAVWRSDDLREEMVHNNNEFKSILSYYNFRDNPPDDPVLVKRSLRVFEPWPEANFLKRVRNNTHIMKRLKGIFRKE